MNDFWQGMVAIATAVVGVAVLAVIVSKNSDTAHVVASLASGLAGDLQAAEAPVSGGGYGTNVLGNNSITNGGSYNFVQ